MHVTEKNPEVIRSIFSNACARGDLLILSTQYFTFESNFVYMDGNEVHARTVSGGEQAMVILGSTDVSLRFPYKLDFMEAMTKLIGLGVHEGKKTIRLALPLSVYTSDGRKTSRITQLEGTSASFNLRGRHIIRADLVDLSATGARLTMAVDLPHGELKPGDRIMLSIHLSSTLSINSGAIVRHIKHRTFGVEFSPELSDSDMISISNWFFKKQQEERELLAHRADMEARAAGAEEKPDEGGMLFVTLDDELDKSLNQLFDADRKFHRVLPDATLLKNAIGKKPNIVIFHMSDESTTERELLKSLAEIISPETPTMLLGTDVDDQVLFETALACKATFSITWTPSKSLFLQRLVLGVMRKRVDSQSA